MVMRKGYIYCIKDESGRRKLGFSKDADIRLDTLQIGNAELLTVEYRIEVKNVIKAELGIHSIFGGDNIRGEWYKIKHVELLQKVFKVVATDTREENLLESLGLR